MTSYTYDVLNWEPINTNSFNLLTKLNIKPDIKLLELFKLAPLNNILCRISGTDTDYDGKIVYGIIDKSEMDNSYYITLDYVWNGYPDENKKGKIEFFEKSVFETIDYIVEPNASPVILDEKEIEKDNKPLYRKVENGKTCVDSRMKMSDILLPIGISLVIIGLLNYLTPKKFLD
jgi:hypothetical protein